MRTPSFIYWPLIVVALIGHAAIGIAAVISMLGVLRPAAGFPYAGLVLLVLVVPSITSLSRPDLSWVYWVAVALNLAVLVVALIVLVLLYWHVHFRVTQPRAAHLTATALLAGTCLMTVAAASVRRRTLEKRRAA